MSYAGPVSRSKCAPGAALLPSANPPRGADDLAGRSAAAKSFRPLPHYSTRQDRAAIFAAGIAVGLAVGAGVALLLAPQSGEDTRHDIARRGRRLSRRTRSAWDDLRLELRRLQRKSLRRREASSL